MTQISLNIYENESFIFPYEKELQTQIISKFAATHITAGDRDRTFVTSQNPHGKEPCGLTFFSGPISAPLSCDEELAYLLNIIEFYSSDF